MTSSELWTRATADRYDAEEAENSSAAVLGPALAFLAELAGDGRALEFAIGTGRVGIPLRERGVPVVGIELSEPMAAVLRRKADEDTLPVTIGDMATTVVPGGFALVYLVYNTISNLLTQDEQVDCFRNAARHLEPGGRFVIELLVPPLRFLPPGRTAVPFDVSERHLGFDTVDLVEQMLVSHHFTLDGDCPGAPGVSGAHGPHEACSSRPSRCTSAAPRPLDVRRRGGALPDGTDPPGGARSRRSADTPRGSHPGGVHRPVRADGRPAVAAHADEPLQHGEEADPDSLTHTCAVPGAVGWSAVPMTGGGMGPWTQPGPKYPPSTRR